MSGVRNDNREPCAMCLTYHRYGTTDPEHAYNAQGCVNSLLTLLEQFEPLCHFEDGKLVEMSGAWAAGELSAEDDAWLRRIRKATP